MPTRRRPSAELGLGLLAAAALLAMTSSIALAAPSGGLSTAFRAAYPMSAPPTATPLAGIDLASFTLPMLHVSSRTDELPADGGSTLVFADASGRARVLVRFSVTSDPTAARAFLATVLRSVSTTLPPATDATLGDAAYGDDAMIAASIANIAYSVRALPIGADDNGAVSVPTAPAIARALRAVMRVGAPVFPTATLTLPATISIATGADVIATASGSQTPQLRAEGAYLSAGPKGAVVHPFAAGKIAVVAMVVDELGRIGVARAESVAK